MAELLITGANGHLGRRLIRQLPAERSVRAVVRSAGARDRLLRHVGGRPGLTISVIDPGDPAALAPIAANCDSAVHLIGTIKAGRDNPLEDAHQRPARALLEAAADGGIRRVVYVSIVGASPNSDSACLRARAEVESLFLDAGCSAGIIRVPMVLGERDRASGALYRRAIGASAVLFRASSLEQPIYAGDVIAAIEAALSAGLERNDQWELAGPESLTRGALVQRAAAALGKSVRILSLPLAFGLFFAGMMELFRANPPVTRDMLKILDHDDDIDCRAALAALEIELTPLDVMLERTVLARRAGPD